MTQEKLETMSGGRESRYSVLGRAFGGNLAQSCSPGASCVDSGWWWGPGRAVNEGSCKATLAMWGRSRLCYKQEISKSSASSWSSMCAPQEPGERAVFRGPSPAAFFTPCDHSFLCRYLLTSVSAAALHKGRSSGAGSELPAWHKGQEETKVCIQDTRVRHEGCARPTRHCSGSAGCPGLGRGCPGGGGGGASPRLSGASARVKLTPLRQRRGGINRCCLPGRNET